MIAFKQEMENMSTRKGSMESIKVILNKLTNGEDVVILGTILLQFNHLYTDEELAKSICQSGRFNHKRVLNTIRKAKKLAFESMITA